MLKKQRRQTQQQKQQSVRPSRQPLLPPLKASRALAASSLFSTAPAALTPSWTEGP
jgi:hypothetical protein